MYTCDVSLYLDARKAKRHGQLHNILDSQFEIDRIDPLLCIAYKLNMHSCSCAYYPKVAVYLSFVTIRNACQVAGKYTMNTEHLWWKPVM